MKQTNRVWSRTQRTEPKEFWMIAVGATAETFSWWSRSLKFGFPLQSPGLWGKRVNLLRDERGLSYVYIIILVCMVVGKGIQEADME